MITPRGASAASSIQTGPVGPNGVGVGQFDEDVELAASEPPDAVEVEAGRGRRLDGRHGRKVHLDPTGAIPAAGQDPASGMEAAGASEDVGRGQGGVTAQVDLHHRAEPPEVEFTVRPADHERCLGQVHLRRHRLHVFGRGECVH